MIYRWLGLGGLGCGQICRILRVKMLRLIINNLAVRFHIDLADVVAVRRCRISDVDLSGEARRDQGRLSLHRRALNGDATRRTQNGSLRYRLVIRLDDGGCRRCRLGDGRRRCWQARWADIAFRNHGELMNGRFNFAAIVTAVIADRPQANFFCHFRRDRRH